MRQPTGIVIAFLAAMVLPSSCGDDEGHVAGPDGGADGPAPDGTATMADAPSANSPDVPPDVSVTRDVPAAGGPTDAPGSTAVAVPECAPAASRFCRKMLDCAPLFLEIAWKDLATCASRMTLDCESDVLARDSGLTLESVETCVRALDTTSCSDFFWRKIDACWARGARADGDRCGSHKQCSSGYCAFQGECGYCAPPGGVGQRCPRAEACLPGLQCLGACVLPTKQDEPCNTQSPCDLDLYCKDGRCQPAGEVGQDCTGNSCSYWKGLFCDPSTGKCETYQRAGPGEPCGVVAGKYAVCVPGDRCSGATQTGTGTCVGLVADGDPCADRNCLYPARCANSICRLPDNARCP